MKKFALAAAAVVLLLGGTVLALGFSAAGTQRDDCPGTITCPLTGEEVCKDRCPLLDAERWDCPGKIECPLTGDVVCADRCPLSEVIDEPEQAESCCVGTD